MWRGERAAVNGLDTNAASNAPPDVSFMVAGRLGADKNREGHAGYEDVSRLLRGG